jgi:hypothetical protein
LIQTAVVFLGVLAAGLALSAREPMPFSISSVIMADLGVDVPGFDGSGRIVSNTHVAVNLGMVHLGYRRYLSPIERTGGPAVFWGLGALVPFRRPALVLRYNYVSIGIERFVTRRIYLGGQVHFSPGMLYHVLYEPSDVPGSMDASAFLIIVPTFYIGYAFY